VAEIAHHQKVDQRIEDHHSADKERAERQVKQVDDSQQRQWEQATQQHEPTHLPISTLITIVHLFSSRLLRVAPQSRWFAEYGQWPVILLRWATNNSIRRFRHLRSVSMIEEELKRAVYIHLSRQNCPSSSSPLGPGQFLAANAVFKKQDPPLFVADYFAYCEIYSTIRATVPGIR
jgi:hypothetical protein